MRESIKELFLDGQDCLVRGDFAAAIKIYKTALADSEADGDEKFLAYTFMGMAYDDADDARMAAGCFQKSQDLAARVYGKNSAEFAIAISNESMVESNRNHFDRAEPFLDRATGILRGLKKADLMRISDFARTGLMEVYANAGSCKANLRKFEEAVELMKCAHDITKLFLEPSNPRRVQAAFELEMLLRGCGRTKEAERVKDEMMDSMVDSGTNPIEAAVAFMQCMANIGEMMDGRDPHSMPRTGARPYTNAKPKPKTKAKPTTGKGSVTGAAPKADEKSKAGAAPHSETKPKVGGKPNAGGKSNAGAGIVSRPEAKLSQKTASNVIPLFGGRDAQVSVFEEECTGYLLKISLKSVKPTVWRRVQVPAGFSIFKLHSVMQKAMGWGNSHLYEFYLNSQRYGDPQYEKGVKDDRKVKLANCGLKVGSKFDYMYDFGDGWMHTVEVEALLAEDECAAREVYLAGKGACPPEDCGGPKGFMHVLECLKSGPKGRRDLPEWLQDYDPEELPACFSAKKAKSLVGPKKEPAGKR